MSVILFMRGPPNGLMTLYVGYALRDLRSTSLEEYFYWYCYENPKDLSVAMLHRNHPLWCGDASNAF